jgi:hypothetical protein
MENGKSRFRGLNEAAFIALVAAVSALLVLATNIPTHHENHCLKARLNTLYSRVKSLEREESHLVREREAIEGDPLFIEYHLRKLFKLKRPGETIYLPSTGHRRPRGACSEQLVSGRK